MARDFWLETWMDGDGIDGAGNPGRGRGTGEDGVLFRIRCQGSWDVAVVAGGHISVWTWLLLRGDVHLERSPRPDGGRRI